MGDERERERPVLLHHGIGIGSTGVVYVVDEYNHRIQYFNASGDFLGTWGSIGDVALSPDGSRFYVADRDNRRVQSFTSDGSYLGQWAGAGGGKGGFGYDGPTGPTSPRKRMRGNGSAPGRDANQTWQRGNNGET